VLISIVRIARRVLVVCALLVSATSAEAYDARLTWAPVANAAGYKLYTRLGILPYTIGLDIGAQTAGSDGLVRYMTLGLPVGQTIHFAVTSYSAGAGESSLSNELQLTYGDFAAIVDTDDDGLLDALEDRNLNGIVDANETSPVLPDTDGDGIGDGTEVSVGSNPLDPNDPLRAPSNPTPTSTPQPLPTALPVGMCGAETVIPAGGGVFAGVTSGTSALTGSCGTSTVAAPEQVFRWTPAISGTAVIQTCDAASTSFDTILYVRSGSCAGSADLTCVDDVSGCPTSEPSTYHGSRTTMYVTAGTSYFIVVDGYRGAQGRFSLTVTPPVAAAPTQTVVAPTRTATVTAPTATIAAPTKTATPAAASTLNRTTVPTPIATATPAPAATTPPPTRIPGSTATPTPTAAPGSACANATVISPLGGVFTGTTTGTSTLVGYCVISDNSPEVVYQWTPTATGRATISTCSGTDTAFDTVVYLRAGDCQAGSTILCNDDRTGCLTAEPNDHHGSYLRPYVYAGQTYFIVVDGYNGARGDFALTIVPPPGSTAAAPTPADLRVATDVGGGEDVAATSTPTPIETPGDSPADPTPIETPGDSPADPTPTATVEGAAPRLTDAHRCYAVSPAPSDTELPIDQVGRVAVDVEKALDLCVVTSDEPSELHLERFGIQAQAPALDPLTGAAFQVTNELGEVVLEVGEPESVIVAATTDLTTPLSGSEPTYTCYDVTVRRGTSTLRAYMRVIVGDRYTDPPRNYTIKEPSRLCLPSDAAGMPTTADEVEVCYDLGTSRGRCVLDAPRNPDRACREEETCGGVGGVTSFCARPMPFTPITGLRVTNPFDTQTLDLVDEGDLCVPSSAVTTD
jgi:thrombospondin type 3 repeat protein